LKRGAEKGKGENEERVDRTGIAEGGAKEEEREGEGRGGGWRAPRARMRKVEALDDEQSGREKWK
jgi:hypothetical protein